MPRVLLGLTAAFALLLAGVFFLKVGYDFSRVWFAAWYAAGAVALLTQRFAVSSLVRHWTRQGRLFRRSFQGREFFLLFLEQILGGLHAEKHRAVRRGPALRPSPSGKLPCIAGALAVELPLRHQ